MRVWGIDFAYGLPRGRPDEELFVLPALRMFGANLDPGLLAYGFPEGYAFLLHAALRIYAGLLAWRFGEPINLGCVYAVNPTNLLLVGRALSALLGTGTLVPAALVARRLVPARAATQAALVAALLLGVNYLHGRDSRFAVTDASMTFFLTWAVWAIVRFAEEHRIVHACLAGVFVGLAISTKWIALFLLPVLGLALLHSLWASRKRDVVRSLMVAIASVAFVGLGFLTLSPHVPGQLHETYSGILSHEMRYDASEVSRFLLDPTVDPGPGLRFHSLVTLPVACGRIGMIAALVGLIWALWSGTRAAWVCSAVLAFVFGGAVGPVRLLFVRYCVPIVPVLAALAAAGVVYLADACSRWLGRPALGGPLLVMLVAATAAEPAVRLLRADEILARADTRELAARWITANTPAESTVGPEIAYTCVYAAYGEDIATCNALLPPPLRGAVPNLSGRRGDWASAIARGRDGWATIADAALNDYWNTAALASDPDYLTQGIPILSCGKQSPVRGLDALGSCWEEVARFGPGTPSCDAVYDLFDQFYMPYAGFDGVERPGPETVVYRNRCKRPARTP